MSYIYKGVDIGGTTVAWKMAEGGDIVSYFDAKKGKIYYSIIRAMTDAGFYYHIDHEDWFNPSRGWVEPNADGISKIPPKAPPVATDYFRDILADDEPTAPKTVIEKFRQDKWW